MLRGIKTAASGIVGKSILGVVIALLVVSFAIWGIGDIFRGFGQNTVAKIGRTEIGREQFRQYYSDQLQQISRRFGRPMSADQARSLGFDRQVISQLVAETILDERARELRLGLPDPAIAARITNDENFKGPNGQFDRFRFEQMIRQAGFNESRYVAEQRRVMLRRAIADSIAGNVRAPESAVDLVNRYRNEKRNIEFITLGEAQAGVIADPSAEALAKFFEDRNVLFRAPEYRKVTILTLTPADRAVWINISDADARAAYDKNKDNYGKAEMRRVSQIRLDNADQEKKAADLLKSGKTFADVAKDLGKKDSDVDLGLVAKTSIIDPAIGDAAFALKEGEVSQPVKGRFGTFLIQVSKIEPAQTQSYEQVAGQIKQQLAAERANGEVLSLRDKIEDERAGGATLAEAAKKFGLTARAIDAIDRSARTPEGSVVADLPKGVDVITTAFNTDVGVESEAQQLQGGGYVWTDVTGVIPARDRPLDEVKAQVATSWKNEEISAKLKTKAEDIAGKIKGGATLAQIAADNKVEVKTASELQRGKAANNVPASVIETAFKTAKGEAGTVEGAQANERVVFRVTEIVEPKLEPGSADAKGASEVLQRAITEDLLAQYIGRLESDMGVSINQNAMNQVIGGAAAN